MYDDGFETTHPVVDDIKNPTLINSLFDSITYDKGCAILFMLESTVGEDVFRQGLQVIFIVKKKFLIFFCNF